MLENSAIQMLSPNLLQVCFSVYCQGKDGVSAHACCHTSAFSFACAAAKADCLVTIPAANWFLWYPAKMALGPKWLQAALYIAVPDASKLLATTSTLKPS